MSSSGQTFLQGVILKGGTVYGDVIADGQMSEEALSK